MALTLQEKYDAKVAEYKALREANAEGFTAEQATKAAEILGQADLIKTDIDLDSRFDKAGEFSKRPQGGAVKASFRESAPGEGDTPIDAKSFRQMEIKTIAGTKSVRFHVPLAVQKKDYPFAFEAYVRKGFQNMGENDRKTLSEGVDSAGGFFVPEDLQIDLLKKTATMAVIRSLAKVIQVSTDQASWVRKNYTTDDKYTSPARITWEAELPASATGHRITEATYQKVIIPVNTGFASVPISNSLIEDSAFNILGEASDELGEAFALGEDYEFINGTGVARPEGILLKAGATNGPAEVITASASALTFAGLVNLYYALPAQYRANAVWVMNSTSMSAIDKLVDSDGRPIISALTVASLQTGEFERIKGKPVLVDEFMPDLAADAKPILFGDFSSYTIADRVGFSIQLIKEKYAEQNITVLLARKRVGGLLTQNYKMKVQDVDAT